MEGKKKKFSIQWRIILIALGCWMIPFVLMMGTMVYYLVSNQTGARVENLTDQVKFNVQNSVERLNQAIRDSRNASYDGELLSRYESYQKMGNADYWLSNRATEYLQRKYSKDSSFTSTVFWYTENPDILNGKVYNSAAGGSYEEVQIFWEKDRKAVMEYAKTLDTSVGFFENNSRIYMVRNIVNHSYETIGVLVMRMNMDYCFDAMSHLQEEFDMNIFLNKVNLGFTGSGTEDVLKDLQAGQYPEGSSWEGKYLFIRNFVKDSDYHLETVVRIPKSVIWESLFTYLRILGVMLALLIPLVFLLIYMVRRHILEPTEQLMAGAREIEKGDLGYQIAYDAGNQEFAYLTDSFNQMSEKLKYQFDHIYEEELALRDARIMALQSHINPHFMNNTLEIINWEARLSGNMKISQMIESLSTLMNAAMDRKKCPEVPLKEELEYVEAYLHIMKERLGDKLQVQMEIDEDTLKEKVPRLILQPVIENAICHGVVEHGGGMVVVRSRKEGDYLYLETVNNGLLTQKETEKVRRLLDPSYDTSKEPSGNMGIANVNQRLAILYGENCGLRIFQEKDDHICARLTIFVGVRAQ